jgi:hypothetical protein
MPKVYDPLSMEECLISGLPMATCAHCRGDILEEEDEDESPYDDWEITRVFEAIYPGVCTIVRQHKIKRGEKVGRVRHGKNPLVPVSGVACKVCIADYPRPNR